MFWFKPNLRAYFQGLKPEVRWKHGNRLWLKAVGVFIEADKWLENIFIELCYLQPMSLCTRGVKQLTDVSAQAKSEGLRHTSKAWKVVWGGSMTVHCGPQLLKSSWQYAKDWAILSWHCTTCIPCHFVSLMPSDWQTFQLKPSNLRTYIKVLRGELRWKHCNRLWPITAIGDLVQVWEGLDKTHSHGTVIPATQVIMQHWCQSIDRRLISRSQTWGPFFKDWKVNWGV